MGSISKYDDAPAGDPQDAPAPRKKAGALQTFRLGSSPLVNTPGFIRYLRNAVRGQKAWAFRVLREGYPGLPDAAIKVLLLGPESGDVVVVECAAGKPRKKKEAA